MSEESYAGGRRCWAARQAPCLRPPIIPAWRELTCQGEGLVWSVKNTMAEEFKKGEEQPQANQELPQALADFLRDHEYACVTQATTMGTAFVVRLPGVEIESLQGDVAIGMAQELYDHPAAPVIRIVFTIYDDPDEPLVLETFINVQDPGQKSDYAALARQNNFRLHFYDETLTRSLSKIVPFTSDEQHQFSLILAKAGHLFIAIEPDDYDFDKAKTAVVEQTNLPLDKFPLGRTVITRAAMATFKVSGDDPQTFLTRHAQGDWGDLESDDRRVNNRALKEGERLLSIYTLSNGERIYVLTEGDRSATIIMLPADY
jgi:hypothetical protein